MTTQYDYLDLQVTLRCNAACRNCIKFCNLEPITGLDYSDSDLTLGQVCDFISDVQASPASINHLVVTGGEPLLHPDVEQIVRLLDTELVGTKVQRLLVNTNLTLPVSAEIRPHIVNYSKPSEAPHVHDAVFLHPADFGYSPTFATCRHYRKWRIVCNYLGYSLCCAADGYFRLFGWAHLLIDRFPESYEVFPLDRMDHVCQHCPFGGTPAKQRDVGCPVSPIYAAQGRANRAGRAITRRLYRPCT